MSGRVLGVWGGWWGLQGHGRQHSPVSAPAEGNDSTSAGSSTGDERQPNPCSTDTEAHGPVASLANLSSHTRLSSRACSSWCGSQLLQISELACCVLGWLCFRVWTTRQGLHFATEGPALRKAGRRQSPDFNEMMRACVEGRRISSSRRSRSRIQYG